MLKTWPLPHSLVGAIKSIRYHYCVYILEGVRAMDTNVFHSSYNGPLHEILVPIAYANSKCSDEPTHLCGFCTAPAAHIRKYGSR